MKFPIPNPKFKRYLSHPPPLYGGRKFSSPQILIPGPVVPNEGSHSIGEASPLRHGWRVNYSKVLSCESRAKFYDFFFARFSSSFFVNKLCLSSPPKESARKLEQKSRKIWLRFYNTFFMSSQQLW